MINMTCLSKLIKGDCLPEHDKKKRLLNQTCFLPGSISLYMLIG